MKWGTAFAMEELTQGISENHQKALSQSVSTAIGRKD